MIKKSRLILSVLLILILSCSKKLKLNENNIFRYNEHSNISSLDPAYSSTLRNIWPVNQLYNGLVQLDDSLNIRPDLASKWVISKDGITYDFFIKKNIYFHKSNVFGKDSTRTVNAQDFEYSFKRLKDSQLGSPGSWVLNNVDSFSALNDSIFSIRLKKPFAAFLGILSMKYCSVVPKEAVEFYGAKFGKNPIGTGPFKFKKWEENIKVVLRKNNQYFEKDDNAEDDWEQVKNKPDLRGGGSGFLGKYVTGWGNKSASALINKLSAPFVYGSQVVVGDSQGFVTVLKNDDGSIISQSGTDGGKIVTRPKHVPDGLIVQTTKGGIYVFGIQ